MNRKMKRTHTWKFWAIPPQVQYTDHRAHARDWVDALLATAKKADAVFAARRKKWQPEAR